ncbi:hypothetical protein [Antarcticimicrobium sediminis]|uniref:Uncharacterized protein n=1 Tax=Antarcticimicrobium sediminis TaxID=2546227 RepID=A0A4R5EKA2_9RHOB|nr:hypothetical protein [Antarcticimicrobium sediminis]TDE34918.1 hypothetical protein E1B25_18480 [Antarcticimicrobium sediminis]
MFNDPYLAAGVANSTPMMPLDLLARALGVHEARPAEAGREHLAGFNRSKRFGVGALPYTATGKCQTCVLRERVCRGGSA